MTDLIKRLEEAEAGSRELDCDLAEMLGEVPVDAFRMHGVMTGRYGTGPYSAWTAPNYTTSVDAALALVERVLPGWCWMIERHKNGTVTAGLHEWNAYREADQLTANTPALALCAAILKATDTGRE
jgi:hypothetical protein